MPDQPLITGGRPAHSALEAATRAAEPEAARVAHAVVLAMHDADDEAFAEAVSRFLDQLDPVQLCGRINALISVLLGLAAQATIRVSAAAGPGDLICLAPMPDADDAERAAVIATSYAASGDYPAAGDVLFAYRDQQQSSSVDGILALLGALTAIIVTLFRGDANIIEHPAPPPARDGASGS